MLDRECAGDPLLRGQVERMLAGAEDERFLAEPSLKEAVESFGHVIEGPGSTRIGVA